MSYTAGGIIQANDYNNLAWGGNTSGVYNSAITNTAQVWGVGFGYRGYGQTTSQIAAVAAGATVTATQWAGLIYTVNNTLGHQSGAAAQLASGSNIGVTAGATISAFANVVTAVSTINTNANIYATQGTTTTGSTFNQAVTGGTGTFESGWTRTITFASANQARYFFNAGGEIKWVITGVTNNDATLRSADLVTQWLTYQAGGTIRNANATPRTGAGGTVNTAATTLGFWQTTTALQEVSKITSANYRYEYNSDYTNVRVKTSGVSGSDGDLGSVMTLEFNQYMFSTFVGLNDTVNVTVSHRIDVVYPESTFLANTWGAVTIT
jgi:hypothetical protein